MCLLLVEDTYVEPLPDAVGNTIRQNKRKSNAITASDEIQSRRTKADSRMSLDRTLYDLINLTDPKISCRHAVILNYYEDPIRLTQEPWSTGPCCDRHDGAGLILRHQYLCGKGLNLFPKMVESSFGYGGLKWPPARAETKILVKGMLRHWRQEVFLRDWSGKPGITSRFVLTDKQIELLSAKCTRFPTQTDLAALLGFV